MNRKLCVWMIVLVITVSSVISVCMSINRNESVGNETVTFQTEPQQFEPEVTEPEATEIEVTKPEVTEPVVPTPAEPETTPETTCATVPEPTDKDTYESAWYTLTAYCPCSICCGQWANGITSTGTVATAGRTIAVDPRVIPYGTEVIINGNTYVAEDCGGAIKGNRIDVYFDTHQEALAFGVQYAEVVILG